MKYAAGWRAVAVAMGEAGGLDRIVKVVAALGRREGVIARGVGIALPF